MAIEKNSFKVLRLDCQFSPYSTGTMSSEDEQLPGQSVGRVESDFDEEDDDEFDDCDSGAGSDDFDLLELGEAGEEFCQVGDQTCCIPFELYDLPGLADVLSLDVWNEVLTEEERFSLTQYLPDMDQDTFLHTLKELLTGCNMHFGNPLDKLFSMLKGGLCEPRVALYRKGLDYFQKHQHYHVLRKHQNCMVGNLYLIRDAWLNCRGYSIEEKLQVLNIIKSQKSLMYETMEEMESDESERQESGDGLWSKRVKNRKPGQNVGRYGTSSPLDYQSHGKQMATEPGKYGKKNPKGTFNLDGVKTSTMKESTGHILSATEIRSRSYGSRLPWKSNTPRTDSRLAGRTTNHVRGDDDEEGIGEPPLQRDRDFSRAGATNKSGTVKMSKRQQSSRVDEDDSFMGLPMYGNNAYGKNTTVNQLSDIKVLTTKPSAARSLYDYAKRSKYSENIHQFAAEDQINYGKGRISNLSPAGSRMELPDRTEPFWPGKAQLDPYSGDPSFAYGVPTSKSKNVKIGRRSPELSINDKLIHSEYRMKPLNEKVRSSPVQSGGQDVVGSKRMRAFSRSEDTESASSESVGEEDDNPLMRSKWAYPRGQLGTKYGPDSGKAKFIRREREAGVQALDGSSDVAGKRGDIGEHLQFLKGGHLSSGIEKKAKMHDFGPMNVSSSKELNTYYFHGPGGLTAKGGQKQLYKFGRNGHMQIDHSERFDMSSLIERGLKGQVGQEYDAPQYNYFENYHLQEEDNPSRRQILAKDNGVSGRFGKKGQIENIAGRDEISDGQLTICNSVKKKRKSKNGVAYNDEQEDNSYLHPDAPLNLDGTNSSRKGSKRKGDDDIDIVETGVSDPPSLEPADTEQETKPQKKFTLIIPTVHTGFSFSIMHLLSAVRMAMVTLLPEDPLEVGSHLDKNDGKGKIEEEGFSRTDPGGDNLHMDLDNTVSSSKLDLPSLTIQEIVNRVRSNPGDPCILETQEPLQDLIRGVLKIFSSRTAPLGAKAWKPLVVYEKSTKSWSWIGPVLNSADQEAVEEVTSPEAWCLPHKTLVKLVDSFANWLKNGQATLQQIGSLPDPPSSLMQYNSDEKERFRDLRAQKSLSTISPSSEEVRAYFRKEEILRYSIPDRAFSYTALDGKKSIVAPLRRCGGKPTSKARDHFMLKRDRPPHVTILCIVRDAAARLPGSIGTRADVCTLIRDSQYIVEDVSDAQVNQVVSGALDRLHYERDPCVQFDGERKLWVYLHRDREEEDFEDDGTSSTKKWKRQKKEPSEPSEQGAVTTGYHGPEELNGCDLRSDLNAEPLLGDDDKRPEVYGNDKRREALYDDGDHVEHNAVASRDFEQGLANSQSTSMGWDAGGLNTLQDSKLLCQENSTNEDFDDEPFCGEPPA